MLCLRNGGWCMHDEAATHYIDMIDQTTLGHLAIKSQFNKTPRAGWQIDPFGHSAVQAYLLGTEVLVGSFLVLAQILRQTGVCARTHKNTNSRKGIKLRRSEEEEELENNKMKRRRKRCSSMKLRHKSKSSASSSSSWSDDLGVDLLREINKKLCNYGDHIRFRGVCKSWRAVGQDLKRAGDVLPWLTGIHIDYNMKKLSYKLNEPLDPINPHTTITTTISHTINLGDYFDDDISHIYYYYSRASLIRYVDGWLHISVYNYKSKSFSFLFISLATKSSFTLPQLNDSVVIPMSAAPDSPAFPMYLAFSAAPDSPDCVFLALHITNDYNRTIGIFRHGDTHWTTTKSVGGWYDKPRDKAVVFIRRVFYFFLTLGIGSYDLDTGLLKVYHFSTMLASSTIHSFFGLDGDLMLAYYKPKTPKLFCISKYDWSTKVWVPPQSLAGQSLYLTRHSVYVDQINYYGISGANKIYVGEDTIAYVDKYTLEDGQLLKCPSTGRRNWGGTSSYITALDIWVDPPDVLLRKG